jgi:hypothetical protein
MPDYLRRVGGSAFAARDWALRAAYRTDDEDVIDSVEAVLLAWSRKAEKLLLDSFSADGKGAADCGESFNDFAEFTKETDQLLRALPLKAGHHPRL